MICAICNSFKVEVFKVDSTLLPSFSSIPLFHNYKNYYCNDCNVVFMHPFPSKEKLEKYYNGDYRSDEFNIKLDDIVINFPIQIPASTRSFQRFKSFYDCLKKANGDNIGLMPTAQDSVIDYGGYQGMFLSSFYQMFGSKCVVYDYNQSGINFARKAFGFTDSVVANDIASDRFKEKFNFVTMLQVLEHISNPVTVLKHIRENVITTNGLFYIEVPNLFGFALSDPTHLFMYSEDSLRYLVESCGYKVLVLYTDGYPDSGYIADCNFRKLVCLATPDPKIKPCLPKISKKTNEILCKASYKKISYAALRKQLVITFQHSFKFLYYFFMVNFLENIFKNNISELKFNLKKRLHKI